MEATTSQIGILEEKLALILRMRDLTASAEISNSHAEEHYITLMSRREAIMTQLKNLDLQLAGAAPEEGADILRGQISEAAKEVLELDNQLALRIPELMRGIKFHLKQLKDGRNVSRAYHKNAFDLNGDGTYNLRK